MAAIRATLPHITAVAEKSATFLNHESTDRFLIPRQFDPAFYLEFYNRAGGPPDTHDTDNSSVPGLVLLPVRHWTGVGLGVAGAVERWQSTQRPVVIIGPANGRPNLVMGGSFLDNGAPNGDREHASINGIANMIVGWTFYTEVAAAATRAGWQPGILLSVLDSGATVHNANARFHMPSTPPPPVVPAGRLGTAYLDAVDAALGFAATPMHQAAVNAAGDQLRALRAAGHKLFVASCGHYLAEELPRDSLDSPFIPIDFRKDMASEFVHHGAAPHDVVLWIGYAGYDCPNAEVAGTFRTLGLGVVLVTNLPPTPAPNEVIAEIPLSWQTPDAVATIPFAPGHVAPLSSIEMALHYLWLRRLVAIPKP